jgi:intracellular sulfur oxidation DsrE/DsrF family protein
MKKYFLVGLASWLALMAPHIAQAQSAAGKDAKTKVVIQVSDDDPKRWNLALNNARNIQNELGASHVDIEIVAFGPGIGMLKADAPTAGRVQEAKTAGIELKACENTMAAQKLTHTEMNAAAGYVPSGVVEIVKKERDGFAYLRP